MWVHNVIVLLSNASVRDCSLCVRDSMCAAVITPCSTNVKICILWYPCIFAACKQNLASGINSKVPKCNVNFYVTV